MTVSPTARWMCEHVKNRVLMCNDHVEVYYDYEHYPARAKECRMVCGYSSGSDSMKLAYIVPPVGSVILRYSRMAPVRWRS